MKAHHSIQKVPVRDGPTGGGSVCLTRKRLGERGEAKAGSGMLIRIIKVRMMGKPAVG
jgi:hypothetical protein